MLFSKSKLSFYPEQFIERYKAAGTLPDDLVELSQDDLDIYHCKQAPEGKMLGAGADGKPVWADKPEPTPEQVKGRRKAEIHSRLLHIDQCSVRPLRAKLAGTDTQDDRDKLEELEAEAKSLRDELDAL